MTIFIISRGLPTPRYPLNGIFEFDQAKALAEKGHNVILISLDFLPVTVKRKWGKNYTKKDDVYIFHWSLPIGMYRRLPFITQSILLLVYRHAVKVHGIPNIVHAHFYFMGAISSILKKKYGIKLVLTEHSSKLNKDISQISKIDQQLARKAYRYADKIFTVSSSLAKRLSENFGITSQIVYNVVDTSTFSYSSHIQKKDFRFISVGNLLYQKGFDILIQAFAQAKFSHNIYLDIIGGGIERTKLEEQICSLKLEHQVKLLGVLSRKEIQHKFTNSHVFVLCSRGETFGVVYIEAMTSGLPVIATNCGGPTDFINEANGLLIPPNDIQQTTLALIDIQKKYTFYNQQTISQECMARFSPDAIASILEQEYYKLFT